MGLGLTLIAVALSYLLGSIPFGVVVCAASGKDPRRIGSGRTGGTNVYRTAGLPAAVLTVVLDILKGYAAVVVTARLVPAATHGLVGELAVALAALAAILGHNYSVFLGLRGGAGSSPNMGAILAYDVRAFVLGIGVGLMMLLGVRIASLASLALAATIALVLIWRVVDGSLPPATLLYAIGQLLLLVWALRPNIARLRAGTERRISFGRGARSAEPTG